MVDARTLDFFGGGSATGSLLPTLGRAPGDPLTQQQHDALAQRYNVSLPAQQTSAYNATYDRTASQASSPEQQLAAYLNGNVGGVTGAYNASRSAIGTPNEMNLAGATPATANAIAASRGIPAPPPTGTAQQALSGAIPTIDQQLASARAAGQAPLQLANGVLSTTGQQAAGLFGAGSGFRASAPQITSGQTYQTPGGAPAAGGVMPTTGPHIVNPQAGNAGITTIPGFTQGAAPASGGAAAAPPAAGGVFQVGARGAQPGMVQLGAAPTVNGASVGMTNPGAAPGAVMPQLGTGGSGNAFQNSFLAQLQQQINAPQGPSIAAAQLKQAQADNAAQLIGAARSGRGGVGDQAEALREAMAGGSALMSDTAGQLATLRAQEEDMNKNRQLSALGLGGQLAGAQREQDLGYRAQNLGALQGDQSAGLAARGQNLQSQIANQGTQLNLEQLRGQLGLGARAQDLSAAQGNQATQLGARAQDVTARAQDLSALDSDANRQLAAQQLALQGQLGLTGLGLQAQGQGLQYSQAANALGLAGEGMAQDAINQANQRLVQLSLGNQANDTNLLMQQNALNAQPSFLEQLGLNIAGGVGNALGGGLVGSLFSPSAPAPAAAAPAAAAAVANYYAPAPTATPYGSSAWNLIGSYS